MHAVLHVQQVRLQAQCTHAREERGAEAQAQRLLRLDSWWQLLLVAHKQHALCALQGRKLVA